MLRLFFPCVPVLVVLGAIAGCSRPVAVARPTEGVRYVVVRVPGMTPQAHLERCTDAGCREVYRTARPAAEVP